MGVLLNKTTGNYHIRKKYHGKDIEKVIGKDKRAAEIALAELENAIRLAKLTGQGWESFLKLERATRPRSFADAVQDYLEERENYKASSIRSYKDIFSNYLSPEFGNMPLNSIGSSEIKRYQVKLSRQQPDGKTLSPRRINNVIQQLSSVLEQEYVRGNINRNTAKGVKKVQEERAEVDPFSRDEISRALTHLDPHYIPFFTVFAYTGARPNELAALRWKDIDFSNEIIKINKGLVRGHEGLPKTRAGQREIPMAPQVVSVLRAHMKQVVVSQQGYVFLNKRGTPIADHIDRKWAAALRKAGIRHRKSYNLRHSFVTECIGQNLPLPYIAKIIGHTTIDTIVRHYAGWISDATTVNNEKLKQAFGNASKAKVGANGGVA